MTPETFIADCRDCIASGGGPADIAALVRAAMVSQRDDPAWQGRDEFLYRSAALLIVNVTLPPHGATPVHDHGMWAVVGVSSGCELDRFYVRGRDGGLDVVEDITVPAGNAIAMDADAIHAIFNPLPSEMRGIHVYGGDMVSAPRNMWHPQTGDMLPYDGKVFEEWCEALTRAARPAQAPAC